ncbi:MAG: pyrroline-5-carboxylate reductase [Castellaniella sp.]
MTRTLKIAFIGGGNMATALASGLIGTHCAADDIHVVDVDAGSLAAWQARGASTAPAADERLAAHPIWVFCVKPQVLREVVKACRPFLQADTLVISVAAGIAASTLAGWLGEPQRPWQRLVRCMPNTPALIGAGAAGLMALDGVNARDKVNAQTLLEAVGQAIWVESDAQIDAVTALSGSGPAYVFLFLQALIEGGTALGLSTDQSRRLALATVDGATRLAAASSDELAVLRARVTSRGGTTAAALQVMGDAGFETIVHAAMVAARDRAVALSQEFSDE